MELDAVLQTEVVARIAGEEVPISVARRALGKVAIDEEGCTRIDGRETADGVVVPLPLHWHRQNSGS
jgi:hypothetical protein